LEQSDVGRSDHDLEIPDQSPVIPFIYGPAAVGTASAGIGPAIAVIALANAGEEPNNGAVLDKGRDPAQVTTSPQVEP
jgi:hypothetical protein